MGEMAIRALKQTCNSIKITFENLFDLWRRRRRWHSTLACVHHPLSGYCMQVHRFSSYTNTHIAKQQQPLHLLCRYLAFQYCENQNRKLHM